MFRDLKRIKQKLNLEECIKILNDEKRGVLSVIGDNNYPYCFPMNYYYNSCDNAIYFHSGKTGHKIDSLINNNKVSFCVLTEGVKNNEKLEWAYTIKSVIAFGNIEIIDINNSEINKYIDIIRKLSLKYTNDNDYINKEIKDSLCNTIILKLNIENICGKQVLEA